MSFYEYRQNNSGGSFDFEEWKVSLRVIIEADSAGAANRKAEDLGLYFDGDGDCPCCGDRWHDSYQEDGDDVPSVHGDPIADYYASPSDFYHPWMGEKHEAYVHYLDGRVEGYRMEQPVEVKAPK